MQGKSITYRKKEIKRETDLHISFLYIEFVEVLHIVFIILNCIIEEKI